MAWVLERLLLERIKENSKNMCWDEAKVHLRMNNTLSTLQRHIYYKLFTCVYFVICAGVKDNSNLKSRRKDSYKKPPFAQFCFIGR